MEEQGTELLETMHKGLNLVYATALKDGISYAKSAINELEEVTLETCNAILDTLIATVEEGKAPMDIPDEVKNSGMSAEAYQNLLDYLQDVDESVEIEVEE